MIHKTIREIAAAWKEYKRPYVKQSTMAAYVLILENHILPTFGEDNSLPEQSVQAFVLHKIESGLSTKSVKDILIVLKMVMKFGVKKEWMTYYEWDIKYPPSSENKVLDVLSVTNHRKILNHIQSHFTFMGLGIYISLSTGLRIGEICALKWSDIDFVHASVSVNKSTARVGHEQITKSPKTKKSNREIVLPGHLMDMLKKYRTEQAKYRLSIGDQWQGDDYLFIQQNGKQMDLSTPYHVFKKVIKNYNKTVKQKELLLPDIPLHGLRHTSATLLISQNVDVRTVSNRLGHAQTSTTMNIYAHQLEKMDEMAAGVLESLLTNHG